MMARDAAAGVTDGGAPAPSANIPFFWGRSRVKVGPHVKRGHPNRRAAGHMWVTRGHQIWGDQRVSGRTEPHCPASSRATRAV